MADMNTQMDVNTNGELNGEVKIQKTFGQKVVGLCKKGKAVVTEQRAKHPKIAKVVDTATAIAVGVGLKVVLDVIDDKKVAKETPLIEMNTTEFTLLEPDFEEVEVVEDEEPGEFVETVEVSTEEVTE